MLYLPSLRIFRLMFTKWSHTEDDFRMHSSDHTCRWPYPSGVIKWIENVKHTGHELFTPIGLPPTRFAKMRYCLYKCELPRTASIPQSYAYSIR